VIYVVTVNATNGFNSAVSFSVSGIPQGATSIFSAASSTTNTTLTVSIPPTAPIGSSNLIITGTSENLAHTVSATASKNNGNN
jgi:hypothetical protein